MATNKVQMEAVEKTKEFVRNLGDTVSETLLEEFGRAYADLFIAKYKEMAAAGKSPIL